MNGGERRIRRVLVTLDAGPDYLAALQKGVELARGLGAEVGVMFVEDADLFRLCELQVVEVSVGSRATRRLDAARLERELRARAAEARANLERLARLAELKWSFDVWRGRADEAVREAARQADLVSLARTFRPFAVPRQPIARRRGPRPPPAPVAALYEAEDDPAAAVIEIAARMARTLALPLRILAPGRPDGADRARKATLERLGALGIDAAWRGVQPTREAILGALEPGGARLLVLSAHGTVMAAGILDELLYATGAEGLIVGGEQGGIPGDSA